MQAVRAWICSASSCFPKTVSLLCPEFEPAGGRPPKHLHVNRRNAIGLESFHALPRLAASCYPTANSPRIDECKTHANRAWKAQVHSECSPFSSMKGAHIFWIHDSELQHRIFHGRGWCDLKLRTNRGIFAMEGKIANLHMRSCLAFAFAGRRRTTKSIGGKLARERS